MKTGIYFKFIFSLHMFKIRLDNCSPEWSIKSFEGKTHARRVREHHVKFCDKLQCHFYQEHSKVSNNTITNYCNSYRNKRQTNNNQDRNLLCEIERWISNCVSDSGETIQWRKYAKVVAFTDVGLQNLQTTTGLPKKRSPCNKNLADCCARAVRRK